MPSYRTLKSKIDVYYCIRTLLWIPDDRELGGTHDVTTVLVNGCLMVVRASVRIADIEAITVY